MHPPAPDIGDAKLTETLVRLAETGLHAFILADADAALVWANPGFTRMTGYRIEDIRGLRLAQFLMTEDSDPALIEIVRAHKAKREPFRVEVEIKDKDGRRFWVDLHVRPLISESGVLEGYSGLIIEAEPTSHLIDRLKAASATLASAAALARLGGWEVDVRRRVVRWSPELRELLGRPSLTERPEDTLDIYPEEVRAEVGRRLQEAVLGGERIEFEAPAIAKGGTRIWMRVIGQPEMENGVCVAVHGASQDITEERMAREALEASERFARGVIDGVGALLVVIDESGLIVEANHAFRSMAERTTGLAPYPMGRNLFDILEQLPGRHGGALNRGIRQVLDGKRQTFDRSYATREGVWYRLTASRFEGEGPVRCVVITQSIDDLKRQEERLVEMNQGLKRARDEARSASQAKSAFLATMSHEIRTPLNGVLGMAQAMARDELSDAQRERLGVIRQAGETLLALLNDLLDLSRIESGRLELEDGVVDIRPLLSGAEATFMTLAAEKDVSLVMRATPAADGAWRGDPTRVRQVLYNLVSNAVKFTAHGSVDVCVDFVAPDLVLTVTDTGTGIAPDRLSHLFEKFVQADASTTRQFGGSGLGLSITRELVEMMGGRIEVKSALGDGSTFVVRLPLQKLDAGAAAPVAAPEPEVVSVDRPLRVLAAEDNLMNQLVLKTLLAQLGLDLVCVGDGRQAVEAWAGGDWDVVLMDVQMPVMDGPAATREIREREAREGLRRTPIIALTANAMAHHHAEYRAAGMDVLVPKPIELERLIMAIQEVLEARDEAVPA